MASAHDRVLYALCDKGSGYRRVLMLGVHSTVESALEALDADFDDGSTWSFALTGTVGNAAWVPYEEPDYWFSLERTLEQVRAWGGSLAEEERAFDPIIATEEVSLIIDKYRRLCGEDAFFHRGWDIVQETIQYVVSSPESVKGSLFEEAFARARRALPGENKTSVPTRHQVIRNIVSAAVERELARRREAK